MNLKSLNIHSLFFAFCYYIHINQIISENACRQGQAIADASHTPRRAAADMETP